LDEKKPLKIINLTFITVSLEVMMELKKLDFSMIGILSRLAGILAENKIGIYAVSTFNTDYIFVKEENFDRSLQALALAGYDIV